nr:MAG TPA: hypothetical protein [Caudoviricetes sp.]
MKASCIIASQLYPYSLPYALQPRWDDVAINVL